MRLTQFAALPHSVFTLVAPLNNCHHLTTEMALFGDSSSTDFGCARGRLLPALLPPLLSLLLTRRAQREFMPTAA